MFLGDVKAPRGKQPAKAGGFHHEGSYPYARTTEMTKEPDTNGLYAARVEVLDEATGKWLSKKKESTFFPREWSGDRVMEEIQSAYANARPDSDDPGVLRGRSQSGIQIEIVVCGGKAVAAYPLHKENEK